MSNLKPRICEWLHNALKELRSKQTMILKGWEKIGLTRAWNNEFKLVAMEANTTISLFIITHDIEKNMEIDKSCTDPLKTTLVVMECCLNEKSTPPSIPTILLSSNVGVGDLRLQTLVRKPKS